MLKLSKHDIKTGDIVTVKLTNSEEIIGTVSTYLDNTIVIEKARLVNLMASPSGGVNIGLFPYVLTASSDVKVTFKDNDVISVAKTESNAKKQYIESTSSISVPKSGLIT